MKKLCIYHGKPVSNLDAAYLAGLIDGEGCISVTRTSTNSSAKGCKRGFAYRSSIAVSMTDESLLRWAQSTTGLGTIIAKKASSIHHKNAWAWQVWSKEAVSLAELILPYLRLKRRQAEKLIEFQVAMRFPGSKGLSDAEWDFREKIYRDFRALNFRGIAA